MKKLLLLLTLLFATPAQAQNLFLANDGTFKAPVSGGVTITGPAAAGNVPVATSSSAASWQNLYGIPATWTAAQTFSANIAANAGITGTLASGFGQALNFTQTPSGSASVNTFYNSFLMTDTATITGLNFGVGHNVVLNISGTQGGREAIQGAVNLTGTTSAGSANRNYVGLQGVATSGVNDNGTSPASSATSAGAVFGGGFIGALTTSSATSFLNLTGAEFNTRMVAGSSAWAKSLAQFSSEVADRVSGTVVDSMLWLYDQSASNPHWNTGILFDGANQPWPIKSTGTIFQTLGAQTAAHGIDLSATTFSSDAFKSLGYTIGPAGQITSGTNGGTGGSLTLNGATSGSAVIGVGAASGTLTTGAISASGTISVSGASGGTLALAGMTSGAGFLQALPTGGGMTAFTGLSTGVVTPFIAEDTVPGGTAQFQTINNSGANSSTARVLISTGVANAAGSIAVSNNTAAPTLDLTFQSGVTSGFRIINNVTTAATWLNGLQVGAAPTGGDKGAGTINVSSNYQANGVTVADNAAWTAFTPSPTCGTATFTVNSARSKTLGKTTFIQIDITFTALGTCTNVLTVNLPNTSQSSGVISGHEAVNNSAVIACTISASVTSMQCVKQTTTAINYTGTDRVIASGVYENQ